jgi:hypothetical protein
MYFSAWFEKFHASFARDVTAHGGIPLIQIEPYHVKLSAIASGKYDGYLSEYAVAVHNYRHPVVLSFGHEMNGNWYSWGYQHTNPKVFVAAWRHIVKVFRALGARNVTWLWTVNIIDARQGRIPAPGPWWPGSSYVDWVGIDGYYYKPSWEFAPLFGPTIAKVRQFTRAPILVAETGAAPVANPPAKISNLFAGVRAYGLMGFVWFDRTGADKYSIDRDPAALAAFRSNAARYHWPRP